MPRQAVAAYFIVLVVVEHEGRYLLIHEQKHGQGWYLPAGRVEPGETLLAGAVRETQEEAGVKVRPTALIALDQTVWGSGDDVATRFRFALLADPVGSTAPKSFADEHSLEARWFTGPRSAPSASRRRRAHVHRSRARAGAALADRSLRRAPRLKRVCRAARRASRGRLWSPRRSAADDRRRSPMERERSRSAREESPSSTGQGAG